MFGGVDPRFLAVAFELDLDSPPGRSARLHSCHFALGFGSKIQAKVAASGCGLLLGRALASCQRKRVCSRRPVTSSSQARECRSTCLHVECCKGQSVKWRSRPGLGPNLNLHLNLAHDPSASTSRGARIASSPRSESAPRPPSRVTTNSNENPNARTRMPTPTAMADPRSASLAAAGIWRHRARCSGGS